MESRAPETSELSSLYIFAVWMIGDRDVALARATEVIEAAPQAGFAAWANAVRAPLSGPKGLPAERREVLVALDELLRTDLTMTPGDHPQIRRNARRLRVLQWELKRSCLFAVMRGIPTGPRAAFVMHHILGISREAIGEILAITQNSLGVHLGRAERVLDDYLGARCQHMAPGNACRCETRLGVALARGFVGWPAHNDPLPDTPVFLGRASDVGSLYGSLPSFTLDVAATRALTAARETVSPVKRAPVS